MAQSENMKLLKIVLACQFFTTITSRILLKEFSKDSTKYFLYNLDKEINQGQCEVDEFTKSLPNNGKYVVEKHIVTTDDGYILQLYRVNLSDVEQQKLPDNDKLNLNKPVLIQHGIFNDSTSIMKRHTNVAYYLIDKGFDCWLGNNRGSKFSISNVNAEISSEDFYEYSITEMGIYDQPAFYREILAEYPQENDKQIIYFGHSNGNTQMFIALNDPVTKDFMRKHTERFFALSPIVFMTQVSVIGLDWITRMRTAMEFCTDHSHLYQIGSINCDFQNTEWSSTSEYMCKNYNFLCTHDDLNIDPKKNPDGLGLDLSHSGIGIKHLVHFAQLIDGDSNGNPVFRNYDYGKDINNKKYHQDEPPSWLFDDFNTPLNLIVGKDDYLGTPANVDELISKLPSGLDLTTDVIPWWFHSSCLHPSDQTMNDIVKKAQNLS